MTLDMFHGFEIEQLDWLIRLLCAVIAGGILGLDRELRHRRVGVRTYMLVSLGSAMFAVIAMQMSQDLAIDGVSSDPTRVIQGIIGGLGFLGAGAIIQGDQKVGGMATAASLWMAGAVGLAAGLGYMVFAVTTACIAAAVLWLSKLLSQRGSDDRPDEC